MAAFFRRDKFVAAGEMMAFREIFSVVIDPNDPTAVNRKNTLLRSRNSTL